VKSIGFKVLACLLLLAGSAAGQKVTLPAEVQTEAGRLAAVKVEYDGDDVRWVVPPELDAFREYDPDPKVIRLRVQGFKEGAHRIIAVTCKGGKLSDFAVCVVKVGKQPDPGPGPKPPDPPVPPTPPDPPAPIPADGFRVLMVYETAEVSKYPAAQSAVLYSKSVRDYLNAKCAAGPDGKTKEWRIWDKDADPSQEASHWQAAMKRTRAGTPWLVVSDGKTGFEGPLPNTVEETLTLLKKYGG
jgi:hypothetical protein